MLNVAEETAQNIGGLPIRIGEALGESFASVVNAVSEWVGGAIAELQYYGEIITGFPDVFKGFLGDFFGNLVEAITGLPETLATLFSQILKDIFVPDGEYIESSFYEFSAFVQDKFHVNFSVFENIFGQNTRATNVQVEDVVVKYNFYGIPNKTFELKVLDASFLKQGVEYFRPLIRSFLVFLMFLFHVKQLISFFGYDAGVVTGRSDHIAEAKKAQKE